MLLSLLGSLFGGLWKLAKLVPWYVWIAAAVAGYGWHWHSGKVSEAFAAGERTENAKWKKAEADAVARAEREAKELQAKVDKEAAESKRAADEKFHILESRTNDLREKLRHANQPKPGATLSIPANCRISPERRDLLNQALGYD